MKTTPGPRLGKSDLRRVRGLRLGSECQCQ